MENFTTSCRNFKKNTETDENKKSNPWGFTREQWLRGEIPPDVLDKVFPSPPEAPVGFGGKPPCKGRVR